ncbi:MlaA family lipoprotein [Candidatus Deianiraea vastatrix]|uniref:VacJ-like lipoprotein family protein n=1 Tax=Candidatus Deianiraea vastatrix TaxID=2163644 RepID=A0A5B8XES1_9RICK|nr:VacJ family lipoprotein [Candidatus Deianiraea vastatrix]QED23740.1 VacJ-like lipoprotein family protein [Candidatus Deianiraea vastatrix]
MRLLLIIFLILFSFNASFAAEYSDDEFAEFEKKIPLTPDPYEKINRKIFAFNMAIDDYFFAPIARSYIKVTSRDARSKVSNFILNLQVPSDIIISATQGDAQGFGILTWRFFINSTFGLFGFFDVANKLDLKPMQKNFSDTLALMGVDLGSYFVLPFFGPSFTRMAIDMPFNMALNMEFKDGTMPISYRLFQDNENIRHILTSDKYNIGLLPVKLIDIRARLMGITTDIDNTAIDRYVAYRDMYYQFMKYSADLRVKIIRNGIYKTRTNDVNITDLSDFCISHPWHDECMFQAL